MRTLMILSAIVILISSCRKDDDFIRTKNAIANITRVEMPDSASLHDTVKINARASAPNGCWSNLHMQLTQTDSFVFTIRGFGDFRSSGTCTDIVITKDTIFNFVPQDTGRYFFLIALNEYFVDVDTIRVLAN